MGRDGTDPPLFGAGKQRFVRLDCWRHVANRNHFQGCHQAASYAVGLDPAAILDAAIEIFEQPASAT